MSNKVWQVRRSASGMRCVMKRYWTGDKASLEVWLRDWKKLMKELMER